MHDLNILGVVSSSGGMGMLSAHATPAPQKAGAALALSHMVRTTWVTAYNLG